MKLAIAALFVSLAAAAAQASSMESLSSEVASARPVRTVSFCRDKESAVPDSAFNSFSPVSVEFLRAIGKRYKGTIDEAQQYKVTLLEQPKHGNVRLVYEPSRHWTYAPLEGYTGADRVIYLLESQGNRFRVVINFWVVKLIDEQRKKQECEIKNFGPRASVAEPIIPQDAAR